MINNKRNRQLPVAPAEPKEAITFIQYEPGNMLIVQVSQGEIVDDQFRPDPFASPENYTLTGENLDEMLADEEVEAAINIILQKCWERIDLKRTQNGGQNESD